MGFFAPPAQCFFFSVQMAVVAAIDAIEEVSELALLHVEALGAAVQQVRPDRSLH